MKIIITENQIRRILNEFDYSDAMKLEKAMLDFYGETYSPSVAGYISPSGHLIDFSGGGDIRGQDHANIEFIFDEYGIDLGKYGEGKWKNSRFGAVYAAMEMGFIRYMPEGNGFDMRDMPTQEQFQVIRQLIRDSRGEIVIDVAEGVGMTYDEETPLEYILTGIKDFYKHGVRPQPYRYGEELYESVQDNNLFFERLIDNLLNYSESESFSTELNAKKYLKHQINHLNNIKKNPSIKLYRVIWVKNEKDIDVGNLGIHFVEDLSDLHEEMIDYLYNNSVDKNSDLDLYDDCYYITAIVPTSKINFEKTLEYNSLHPFESEIMLTDGYNLDVIDISKFYN